MRRAGAQTLGMSHPPVILPGMSTRHASTASPACSTRPDHPSAGARGRPDRRADRGPAAQRHVVRDTSRRCMRSRAHRSRGISRCSRGARSRVRDLGVTRDRGPPLGAARASTSPKSSRSWLASARSMRLDGVRGRRSGALFDSDLTVRHRIPTVTAERALIDVSSRCSRPSGSAVCSTTRSAAGCIDLEEFRRCAQRLLPAPGRSMSKVHAVLGARDPRLRPGRQRPRDPSAARAHRRRAPAAQAAAPHDAAQARTSASTSPIPS